MNILAGAELERATGIAKRTGRPTPASFTLPVWLWVQSLPQVKALEERNGVYVVGEAADDIDGEVAVRPVVRVRPACPASVGGAEEASDA